VNVGEQRMKKRQYKKLAKNRCMKCGNTGGVVEYRILKTGRWMPSRLYCFYCDIGAPRIK